MNTKRHVALPNILKSRYRRPYVYRYIGLVTAVCIKKDAPTPPRLIPRTPREDGMVHHNATQNTSTRTAVVYTIRGRCEC